MSFPSPTVINGTPERGSSIFSSPSLSSPPHPTAQPRPPPFQDSHPPGSYYTPYLMHDIDGIEDPVYEDALYASTPPPRTANSTLIWLEIHWSHLCDNLISPLGPFTSADSDLGLVREAICSANQCLILFGMRPLPASAYAPAIARGWDSIDGFELWDSNQENLIFKLETLFEESDEVATAVRRAIRLESVVEMYTVQVMKMALPGRNGVVEMPRDGPVGDLIPRFRGQFLTACDGFPFSIMGYRSFLRRDDAIAHARRVLAVPHLPDYFGLRQGPATLVDVQGEMIGALVFEEGLENDRVQALVLMKKITATRYGRQATFG